MNSCRYEIEYRKDENISKIRDAWATIPANDQNIIKDSVKREIDSVKVLESQPTLPYKVPYSYESPNPVQCNSLPKLPYGVTLPMVKKQYNEMARITGLTIPFPDDEKKKDYNYTMLYIILLLIVVVVVAVIYAMSRPSKPASQTNLDEYYY